MKIGHYVRYYNDLFLVVDIIGDKAKIISPAHRKRFVLMSRLEATLLPQVPVISYRGVDYLVTRKDLIISLRTNKIMNWKQYHGPRIDILRLAYKARL